MRFLPNSRTSRILELSAQGKSAVEIAREVGVDRTYVYQVRKRYAMHPPRQYRTMTISSVSLDEFMWMRKEAIRLKTTVRDIARALLVDAIEEARNGKR